MIFKSESVFSNSVAAGKSEVSQTGESSPLSPSSEVLSFAYSASDSCCSSVSSSSDSTSSEVSYASESESVPSADESVPESSFF